MLTLQCFDCVWEGKVAYLIEWHTIPKRTWLLLLPLQLAQDPTFFSGRVK